MCACPARSCSLRCLAPDLLTILACLQWQRFMGFVQAGDAKEAWLSIRLIGLRLQSLCPSAMACAAADRMLLHGQTPTATMPPPHPLGLCSASTLQATLPAALLALALHSSVWGGAPPAPVAAAELAAYAGAAIAASTEIWKILDGLQG